MSLKQGRRRLFPLLLLPLLFSAAPSVLAGHEISATIAKDETNEFSCLSRKRVPVLVQVSRELLPDQRYQYGLGGQMHVICADFSGAAPQIGKKVRISLNDNAAQIVQ